MATKPFGNTTVLLGVSGSIAVYKACDLVRGLVKRGADVHVLMTANAAAFVTPMTFQTLSRNPVTTGLFDEIEAWEPGHVALADKAAVLAVAPATANVIAKLACGIADDALTSTALAFGGPVVGDLRRYDTDRTFYESIDRCMRARGYVPAGYTR